MALNGTQFSLMQAILQMQVEGILYDDRLKLSEVGKDPQKMLTTLHCVLADELTPSQQLQLIKWDVWENVQQIREMLTHPAPQNRSENYPYFGVPQDPAIIVYPDAEGKPAFEAKGLLGLSARTDTTEAPATREDVVNFIKSQMRDKIEELASYQPLRIPHIDAAKGFTEGYLALNQKEKASARDILARGDILSEFLIQHPELLKELGKHKRLELANALAILQEKGPLETYLHNYPLTLFHLVELKQKGQSEFAHKMLKSAALADFLGKNPTLLSQCAQLSTHELAQAEKILQSNTGLHSLIKQSPDCLLRLAKFNEAQLAQAENILSENDILNQWVRVNPAQLDDLSKLSAPQLKQVRDLFTQHPVLAEFATNHPISLIGLSQLENKDLAKAILQENHSLVNLYPEILAPLSNLDQQGYDLVLSLQAQVHTRYTINMIPSLMPLVVKMDKALLDRFVDNIEEKTFHKVRRTYAAAMANEGAAKELKRHPEMLINITNMDKAEFTQWLGQFPEQTKVSGAYADNLVQKMFRR